MISPQEQGAKRQQVTVTLMGTEIGVVVGWLDAYPAVTACSNHDPQCDGVNVLEPDTLNTVCRDCAEMSNIGLTLHNVREEIKRQWQIAMSSNGE